MPLTGTQKGKIGENEASKIGMLTTDGELEFDLPATDDEARDAEIHERGHFGLSLGLQIKMAMRLYHDRGKKANHLTIQFRSRHPVVISHPLYWFLFAYLDPQTMVFRDPLFLIPSALLFAHVKPRTVKWRNETKTESMFIFRGNMEPESHDMWAPYRVMCRDLGPRLLQILREAEQSPKAPRHTADFSVEPGTIWVARRRSSKLAA